MTRALDCTLQPPARVNREEGCEARTINTGTDKLYVRRDAQGRFKESDDVGRSLNRDRARKATTKAKKGHGDCGDR